MSALRQPLPNVPGKTSLIAGAKVGKYTVELLATGGMSVVYKGRFQDETFALKEVAIDHTSEVPSLMSEKSLLERLDHPGLVRYIDFLVQDGFYYLVVEYVDGSPMSQWIEAGESASAEEIVDWGCQLTEIFEYLHAANPPIIYRDLKPGNVMVTPAGRIKLIDFGIARLHKGHRNQDTSLLGSMQTASPEHYGMSETDSRSDIYTLGMTLYLLFAAGKVKKEAFLVPTLASARPDLPDHIVRAVDQAVKLDPKDRHQCMAEFRSALSPRLEGRQLPECASTPVAEQEPEFESEATVELPMLQLMPPAQPPASRSFLWWLLLPVARLVLGLVLGLVNRDQVSPPAQTATPHQEVAQSTPVAASKEGLAQRNFPVDLFAGVSRGDQHLVMLGEEIGLFQVSEWQEETGAERAVTIAGRLNDFYRQFCPLCGGSKLEPGDVRVGDYEGSTVIFFAHQHGDDPAVAGPLLLATVTPKQAEELGTPARFIACYWRDLVRDTVQLSRGQKSRYSVLGAKLELALARARAELSGGQADTRNLQTVLRELTGSEAGQLQDLYRRVPDRPPTPDEFSNLQGYRPLRI